MHNVALFLFDKIELWKVIVFWFSLDVAYRFTRSFFGRVRSRRSPPSRKPDPTTHILCLDCREHGRLSIHPKDRHCPSCEVRRVVEERRRTRRDLTACYNCGSTYDRRFRRCRACQVLNRDIVTCEDLDHTPFWGWKTPTTYGCDRCGRMVASRFTPRRGLIHIARTARYSIL